MKALESQIMDHRSGVLKDLLALILGWFSVIPGLKLLLVAIDPKWVAVIGAVLSVIVGRAAAIADKEFRFRRRRNRK